MAWCPSCNEDRPISRQTFEGACPHCGQAAAHAAECRGPVLGALNVCQFCHEPVFAKARSRDDHQRLMAAEAASVTQRARSARESLKARAERQERESWHALSVSTDIEGWPVEVIEGCLPDPRPAVSRFRFRPALRGAGKRETETLRYVAAA